MSSRVAVNRHTFSYSHILFSCSWTTEGERGKSMLESRANMIGKGRPLALRRLPATLFFGETNTVADI